MSTFTTPLVVTPLADGKRWRLVWTFEYHVGRYPSDDIIKVPSGFVTDFASIPRPFWTILPPWGKYGKAAVVHDYLCTTKTRDSKKVHKLFLDAMQTLGVPKWKRRIMYAAVRCCGPRFKARKQ